MLLEGVLLALAVLAALVTRPWRMFRGGALISPWLTFLLVMPWLWALPRLHPMPLQLQWSGACLAVLVLGWPLAIPTLVLVALVSQALAVAPWPELLGQLVWSGAVPATLTLAVGFWLRRWLGTQPFVYVLGRAFLGTVLCNFVSASAGQWWGHELAGIDADLSLVARWLLAWSDGFMTGMFAAVFVAFRPQWLATWSDRLYLQPKDAGLDSDT